MKKYDFNFKPQEFDLNDLPPILYKYRDWTKELDKTVLTEDY